MHGRALEKNSSAFPRFCLTVKNRTIEKTRLKNLSLNCFLVSFHPVARFTNKIKYTGIAQQISKEKALWVLLHLLVPLDLSEVLSTS